MGSIKVYPETDFKETSIGRVPRDWDVTKIEEVCEVVGGGTPSTHVKEYWNGEIPFVTPTDITELEERNVNFLDKTKSYITKKGLKNSSAKLLPPNSVLLTSRATIGYGLINKIPMATNQGFANLICSERAHNLYVLYLMRFLRKTLLQIASGSTFKEVARGVIRNLRISLPSIQEQRMISDILCIVDEVLFKTDEIITKIELLKRGLMQELLTKGIGHKEFKDTEIGKLPKTWQVAELGTTYSIYDCKHRTPKYVDKGYPIVRPRDVQPGCLNLEKCLKTSQDDYNDLTSKYAPKKGDIIFTRNASFGVACYVGTDRKFSIGQDVVAITSDNQSTKFLFYVMNSDFMNAQVNRLSTGSTFKRINLHLIRKLKFALPSHAEQENISEILSIVDSKLNIEREEKARLETLKLGLMDLLLTGKVRVKVD